MRVCLANFPSQCVCQCVSSPSNSNFLKGQESAVSSAGRSCTVLVYIILLILVFLIFFPNVPLSPPFLSPLPHPFPSPLSSPFSHPFFLTQQPVISRSPSLVFLFTFYFPPQDIFFFFCLVFFHFTYLLRFPSLYCFPFPITNSLVFSVWLSSLFQNLPVSFCLNLLSTTLYSHSIVSKFSSTSFLSPLLAVKSTSTSQFLVLCSFWTFPLVNHCLFVLFVWLPLHQLSS